MTRVGKVWSFNSGKHKMKSKFMTLSSLWKADRHGSSNGCSAPLAYLFLNTACSRPHPGNLCENRGKRSLSLLLLGNLDFLVRVGPKWKPISFYPYLGPPTGRERLIQGAFCFPPPPTSENIQPASLRLSGDLWQIGLHHGQGACPPLSSPPLASRPPIWPQAVPCSPGSTLPLGPDDSLASLICPPVFLPAHWFWMTLQLSILPAHSPQLLRGKKTGRGESVCTLPSAVSSQVRDFRSLLCCRALQRKQVFRSITH